MTKVYSPEDLGEVIKVDGLCYQKKELTTAPEVDKIITPADAGVFEDCFSCLSAGPNGLLNDLAVYLKMEEASGNLYDEVSMTTKTADAGLTYSQTGKNGNAINFPRFNGRVNLGTPCSGATTWVLSVWGDYPASLPTSTSAYWFSNLGANNEQVYRDASTNQMTFGFTQLGGTFKSVAVPSAGWHHFLFVYVSGAGVGGNTGWIYIDGVLDNTTTGGSNAAFDTGVTDYLGFANPTNNNAEMTLDEYAIWVNKTFASESEITEMAETLYNGGAGLFYDDFDNG